ncbi:hypothetical protein [Serratia quinivorans]|uniref:hypothetical protein n=1 Tax=Serratia quinivorans TaxID=137545 RepID=UPI002178A574|nr:hypothetical protein [Serratia quinivorans]CAI0962259.1 Uncharacterised protein [Serratia quinivorans]CAI1719570.1 Uncharacterised protein [Serratia quinivorans]
MKKTLILTISLVLLNGCAHESKPIDLYQDANGDTAKLRVIGFTDYTSVHQILSCNDSRELGYLRDQNNEERNPPRVLDKGYQKSVPSPENVPLDYQERLISAKGWFDIRSALFASDGGICVLNTHWFKPEKDSLYEIRNRLNKAGNICSMEFVQIDQSTGKAKKVEAYKKLDEFLPCETLSR